MNLRSLKLVVARREAAAKTLDLLSHIRIEGVLEIAVERSRAENAALHWAKHLHVANGIKAEAARNSGRRAACQEAQPIGNAAFGEI